MAHECATTTGDFDCQLPGRNFGTANVGFGHGTAGDEGQVIVRLAAKVLAAPYRSPAGDCRWPQVVINALVNTGRRKSEG